LSLKGEILDLLRRDEEFRYAVAGLIGLEEVLRRLDRHEAELVRLREDMNRLREDMLEGFRRHDEALAKHSEEIAKLREDMIAGFRRHDEILAKHSEEIARLREDMIAGFKRHDEILAKHSEEIAKLREDMIAGFRRHDEILAKHSEEIARLREDMVAGFRRHDEEIARLREDMNKGFALLERHISALGARWGLMSEEAFREGLRGLLEGELGLKVERWAGRDAEGIVYGYPSLVEVDVAMRDGRAILVEVKAHASASDVYALKRKAELYERLEGRRPSRLILITPYADEGAKEACLRHGVELYARA